jgi:hypothetical protein
LSSIWHDVNYKMALHMFGRGICGRMIPLINLGYLSSVQSLFTPTKSYWYGESTVKATARPWIETGDTGVDHGHRNQDSKCYFSNTSGPSYERLSKRLVSFRIPGTRGCTVWRNTKNKTSNFSSRPQRQDT